MWNEPYAQLVLSLLLILPLIFFLVISLRKPVSFVNPDDDGPIFFAAQSLPEGETEKKEKGRAIKKSITRPVSMESAVSVMEKLNALLLAAIPNRERRRILVATDEVFANIVHHSQATEVSVELEIVKNDGESGFVKLIFSDNGVPFDPLNAPTPDISLPLEDRPIGGLGIFITTNTMDEAFYRYEDGKNILTVIKRF